MSTPIPQRAVSSITSADLPFPGGVILDICQSARRPHLAFIAADFEDRGETVTWTVNLQDLARCGAGHGFGNGSYFRGSVRRGAARNEFRVRRANG